jgi:hypothetical protein
MSTGTYRLLVVGAILSSFMLGMLMPVMHDIFDHGARPRWDIVIASGVLALIAITCGWRLLTHRR